MRSLSRRTLLTPLIRLALRPLSTTTSADSDHHLTPPIPVPNSINPRTRTPLVKQFETGLQNLKHGFTQSDVDLVLRSQPDPDIALDIFRWTAQQRYYKHNDLTYLTMIEIAVSGKRYGVAETLIEEVISGACPPNLLLFNAMIKFCCGRKHLFNRSFDIYKKMTKSEDAKPSLETYALLLNSLLKKFDRLNICYGYLHAVRSLAKQMKAYGVIPDTFVLNMIIKAYSKCLEMDEAIRVFREMGLYGCEPNAYTYSYIAKGLCEKGRVNQGLCEKGRVNQGLGFYKEMREKGLVPKGSTYLILICSLALERRFEDSIEAVFDMLGYSMSPDLLTYKTLLDEMCRDGRGNDAFELIEKFRKRDSFMNEKTYCTLLNGLHFLNREI